MSEVQCIQDNADLKRYRTEIPNMVFDIGLTPYEVALYGHFKRVCGSEPQGKCWKSVKTLSKETRMSTGRVSEARTALAKRGLIKVGQPKGPGTSVTVAIVDIWPQNMIRYAPKETLHNMKGSSYYEDHPSGSEDTLHNMNLRNNPKKKEPKKKLGQEVKNGAERRRDGFEWFFE